MEYASWYVAGGRYFMLVVTYMRLTWTFLHTMYYIEKYAGIYGPLWLCSLSDTVHCDVADAIEAKTMYIS